MAKNISVLGGMGKYVDDKLRQEAYALGKFLGINKSSLITSGSNIGLIKSLIDGYINEQGSKELYGIMPKAFKTYDIQHPQMLEKNFIWPDNEHECMQYFIDKSDIAVFLPGGFGTLNELSFYLAQSQLGFINKKIILLNIENFWDPLLQQFDVMLNSRIMEENYTEYLDIASNVKECLNKIYEPAGFCI